MSYENPVKQWKFGRCRNLVLEILHDPSLQGLVGAYSFLSP